jgi:succinoglycan biosynthesis protein ExoA
VSAAPFATVAIPTLNEARAIRDCLGAVVAQDYPHDRYEVLVLDGGSTDATRAAVEQLAATAPVPVRLLENPGRTVPAALNIALARAGGDYLVRVDAHSVPSAGYLRGCIEGAERLGADLAGGWVEAHGETAVGRAVAAAFASPFAMGSPTAWNPPTAPREIASVPCGAYRLDRLRALGGFDEGQHANQDFELNYRIRAAGGRVVLVPDASFRYVTRGSFPKLARQFARYGYYKARTMAKHPRSVKPRQVVPPVAVLAGVGLVAAAATSPRGRTALAAAAGAYGAMLAAASATAPRLAPRDRLLLVPVLATMHVAWGAGNVVGLARWLPVRRSLRG